LHCRGAPLPRWTFARPDGILPLLKIKSDSTRVSRAGERFRGLE
jgi:hypothetical protein